MDFKGSTGEKLESRYHKEKRSDHFKQKFSPPPPPGVGLLEQKNWGGDEQRGTRFPDSRKYKRGCKICVLRQNRKTPNSFVQPQAWHLKVVAFLFLSNPVLSKVSVAYVTIEVLSFLLLAPFSKPLEPFRLLLVSLELTVSSE